VNFALDIGGWVKRSAASFCVFFTRFFQFTSAAVQEIVRWPMQKPVAHFERIMSASTPLTKRCSESLPGLKTLFSMIKRFNRISASLPVAIR
jgi:hypothetical protein